jgi:hypothetical protein
VTSRRNLVIKGFAALFVLGYTDATALFGGRINASFGALNVAEEYG